MSKNNFGAFLSIFGLALMFIAYVAQLILVVRFNYDFTNISNHWTFSLYLGIIPFLLGIAIKD